MYAIIPEVCLAIWEVLQPLYLECPNTEEKWKEVAEKYNELWNFPNCIGAIDGKHCRIQDPSNSGSAFHNYKGYFSLVLLAIVDANYRFLWIDVGDYGSLNDAGIWAEFTMQNALESNHLEIRNTKPLPNTDVLMPYWLVGDEGFPLKRYLMRPYARRNLLGNAERVFNYGLFRARRVVENAFGILVSRWRILHNSIAFKLSTIEKIIQALACLQNFLATSNLAHNYVNDVIHREGPSGEIVPGSWRDLEGRNMFFQPLERVGANHGAAAAIRQRDTLASYFISAEGSIPWQWQNI